MPAAATTDPVPAPDGRTSRTGARRPAPRLDNLPPVRRSAGVRLLRIVFTGTAALTAAMFALWPYLSPNADRFRVAAALPVTDLGPDRDAMLGVTVTGIDRQGRPFTIESDVVRALSRDDQRLELVRPRMATALDDGRPVTMAADGGIYDRRIEQLRLSGSVRLDLAGKQRIDTSYAVLDIRQALVHGDRPVVARGPFGTVEADGFRLDQTSREITFTGGSRLVVDPSLVEGNG